MSARAIGRIVIVAIAGIGALATPHAAPAGVSRADIRWLNRVTFGIDSATVASYQREGRNKFLDEQLHGSATNVDAAVHAVPVMQRSAEDAIAAFRVEQQRINAIADPDEKQKARTLANQAANQAVYETSKVLLMRSAASSSQLREQMTWFWMNHFSVFAQKANIRWTLADYQEAVRAHALGKFSELVMATLTSPAMMDYLDNAQSAAGKINENYARELMELHTLGVSGGASGSVYTQQDVQELARVLTGAGVNFSGNTPRLAPKFQPMYVKRGAFEFNPARHDQGSKTVLGHTFAGGGLDEIENAVVMLCRQPATARFISTKLATYFIADAPPAPLVDRMARTFTETDGSIAAVLKTMFLDKAFLAALDRPEPTLKKFKDPAQFVVSSVRLAYDGKTITNFHPVVNWLQQLGEPLYLRVTPDGYPLTEDAWASSGQLVKRFEIARQIGGGNAGLFNNDDNTPGPFIGFPLLNSRLYYNAIEPALGAKTTSALSRASSQQEWNLLLLASPDWMQR
jgi:uncharacterized protein (DUF1800 family)